MRARPSVSGRVRFQTYAWSAQSLPSSYSAVLRNATVRPAHRSTAPIRLCAKEVAEDSASPDVDIIDHKEAVHLEGPLTEEPVDEDLWKRVRAVDQDEVERFNLELGQHVLGSRVVKSEAGDVDPMIRAVLLMRSASVGSGVTHV